MRCHRYVLRGTKFNNMTRYINISCLTLNNCALTRTVCHVTPSSMITLFGTYIYKYMCKLSQSNISHRIYSQLVWTGRAFWRPHNCIRDFNASKWVITLNGLSWIVNSEVHVIHISHVIMIYTLELLYSLPHIDNTQSTGYNWLKKKWIKKKHKKWGHP